MPLLGCADDADSCVAELGNALRTFEQKPTSPRGAEEARAAGVKFYDVERL